MSEDRDNNQTSAQAQLFAAHTAAVCKLIGLLIQRGALDKQEVIAAYEGLSSDLVTSGNAVGVQITDMIRDYVAGVERGPSI